MTTYTTEFLDFRGIQTTLLPTKSGWPRNYCMISNSIVTKNSTKVWRCRVIFHLASEATSWKANCIRVKQDLVKMSDYQQVVG